jgi:hypothetical protein
MVIVLRLSAAADAPDPGKGSASRPTAAADEAEDGPSEPIWENAACYVCHMTFVQEELSKVHVADKVTCIKCHGLSAAHANDENVGATPPDVTFERNQVDAMCVECHKDHDVPLREVLVRFLVRKLSRKTRPVCTDCHGFHKIERPSEEATGGEKRRNEAG